MLIRRLTREKEHILMVFGGARDNVGAHQGPLHLYPIIDRFSKGVTPVHAKARKPTREEIIAAGPSYQAVLQAMARKNGISVDEVINNICREEEYSIGTGKKSELKRIVITGTINEQEGQEGEFDYFISMLNDAGYAIHSWVLSNEAREWISEYLKYIKRQKPKARIRPDPKQLEKIKAEIEAALHSEPEEFY